MVKPASAWAGQFQGNHGAAVAALRDDGQPEPTSAVTIAITRAMGGTRAPTHSVAAMLEWSKGDDRAFVQLTRPEALALREALNDWFRPHDPSNQRR